MSELRLLQKRLGRRAEAKIGGGIRITLNEFYCTENFQK
jgi:hypothetical protein